MLKSDAHIFAGMQQDISVSKHPAQYLIDAHNVRLSARDEKTALSLTSEKGPKQVVLTFKYFNGTEWYNQREWDDNIGDDGGSAQLTSIEGTYMGHTVLNNYLVLFTHISSNKDAIYRIDLSTNVATRLYIGDLNFNIDYPIQALASYENDSIQKVYWTDNYNQPRIINVSPSKDSSRYVIDTDETDNSLMCIYSYNDSYFDFSPELKLTESITVTKNYSGGQFPAGVIQYAITYYNKYAQETSIAAVTPLYYTSPYGRGGSPEETCNNSFLIEVSGVDTNFEYLRIYSILRTSLNGTPICKRLQDIKIVGGSTISYVDTGTNGDSVDPSALLFLGGEEIKAETMCQKDGTLFLGNITLKRPSITSGIKSSLGSYFNTSRSNPVNSTSDAKLTYVSKTCPNKKIISSGDFTYASTLEAYGAGFKAREYYRLGLQFQYKTGVWSEPVWIMDHQVNSGYTVMESNRGSSYNQLTDTGDTIATTGVPKTTTFYTTLNSTIVNALKDIGYKKVRAVIATPSYKDRTIIFQGVYNPTMYRYCDRYGSSPSSNSNTIPTGTGHLYAQASWIFRPYPPSSVSDSQTTQHGGVIFGGDTSSLESQYVTPLSGTTVGPFQYSTELQGLFTTQSSFHAEDGASGLFTINSPDILWDDVVQHYSFSSSCKVGRVGLVRCFCDYGDLDITTSSGTIGSLGAGFIPRSLRTEGYGGLISQPCYQDSVVDDDGTSYKVNSTYKYPVIWMVYMWHRNGSLNNDVNREGRSAMLKTKKISNYRLGDTYWYGGRLDYTLNDIKIFNSEELQYLKVNSKPYMGNIDTLLVPELSGFYFNSSPNDTNWKTNATPESRMWNRLIVGQKNDEFDVGLWQYIDTNQSPYAWTPTSGGAGAWTTFGDVSYGLGGSREGIRMKYKSTPHAVLYGERIRVNTSSLNYVPRMLPIAEVYEPYNKDTLYGGTSDDALKAISWIPAGPAVALGTSNHISWEWGDTFFNRWDCLKTYAFTKEDQNQVVDILSFPVESHVNLDGRYDRNRGQSSNLNMSPTNYNLMNMVYSQLNNFFSYRIMDNDYYDLDSFSNQVTWTSEKTAGSSVDPWTQVTLASTYDLDGSKGQIRALKTWNNSIYCFQDTGICNIIFNPRVQIPTSDGIPIEIGNSYKVEGIRYLSESLGCKNKSAICESSSSLYFIDGVSKGLYAISNGFTPVSDNCNMKTWFSRELSTDKWLPSNYTTQLFYDNTKKDLYISTSAECLCFSENLGQFISFISYENLPAMFNIGSDFYALKNNQVWKMFDGEYNKFFGTYQPFDITFVSNADSSLDKIFTNLELRADFYNGEKYVPHTSQYTGQTSLIWQPAYLVDNAFFDYIIAEDEYQYGTATLNWDEQRPSNLKKKFRVWRVDVPRDTNRKLDRIRNTWCKITLGMNNSSHLQNCGKMELHDVAVQYFV